jgi:hypothetical protein
LKDLIRASGWGGSLSPMMSMFQNTMHFAGAAVLMAAQTTGGGDSSDAQSVPN